MAQCNYASSLVYYEITLCVTLSLSTQIGIHFSEHILSTGSEKPRLDLKIKSVTTEMKLRSWDLQVAASVGSAAITDYYSKGSS